MDNKEEKSIHNIEVYIGGIAALLAISAVLYKASINGFSKEAVLDALISISGYDCFCFSSTSGNPQYYSQHGEKGYI